MPTRVLRRPILFLRVRCSILILLIKNIRCSIRSLYHTPLYPDPRHALSGHVYSAISYPIPETRKRAVTACNQNVDTCKAFVVTWHGTILRSPFCSSGVCFYDNYINRQFLRNKKRKTYTEVTHTHTHPTVYLPLRLCLTSYQNLRLSPDILN
jgi:hypothetical protein